MSVLLDIRDLKTYFYRRDGVVRAVDGISYAVYGGESVGIVGESGSGKSVSMLSIVKLIGGRGKIEAGEVFFEGRNLLALDEKALQDVRGNEIGFVFQNPQTSLNPTMRSGPQIEEPILWHGRADRKQAFDRAVSLLEEVGIPAPSSRYRNYPFELSGGMKQRVMIAMAFKLRAEADDRRRTDDGAGCDDAGADRGSDEPDEGVLRDVDGADYARFRSGRGVQRPDCCDVRRQGG